MANQDDGMDFAPVTNSQGVAIEPGRYLVKLIRFEKLEDGEFGPRRRWVFAVADAATQTPLYQTDGRVFELGQTTSTKMGKKANARKLFEGLLGRELTDGEDGRAIAQEALGKKALALIGPNQNGWIEILSLTPATNGKAAKEPVAAGAPAPKNALDPFAE